MKSQALTEYGAPLQPVESETPTPSGTEVLLRTTHCGVCHSDVHIQDGHFEMGGDNQLDIRGGRELPFTMGHEIEGEVITLGPEATGVEVGKKYVIWPWIGCQNCPACERDEEQLCRAPQFLGVNVSGGYSDHVLAPHPRYLFDYDGIADGLAATYMCSGITAFGALKKVQSHNPNERVMIVGLGGVGMMGLQFARSLFEAAPLVADVDPHKLQEAMGAGAHAAYDPLNAEDLKKLHTDTGGGVVAAIDFVGSEASLAFAQGAVRQGGQVVVVGLFGGGLAMPIPMFPLRALSICGSFVGSLAETHQMMDLVRSGKVDPIPVTERPLDQASQALEDLREGKIMGRVVLIP
ncbi:MAG: alcohol dehydrogenase [Parvularculales bacterium]